jgi:ubiquinone/menaquinone biosynthesis C-methylase UbiE
MSDDSAADRVDRDPNGFRRFYAERAEEYEALVSAEDVNGQILPALEGLIHLDGARVLEIGVGTGRVTELLLAAGATLVGCEPAAAMLEVARRRLARFPAERAELRQCKVQELDTSAGGFDLALAGWVLGHFVEWYAPTWRDEIGGALDRMERALVPGGLLVILETLGTGQTEPAPPSPGLAEYYRWLEEERGLERMVLRTDYAFQDVDSAAAVAGAFFGEAFAERVRRESWSRIPECTGLWWRRLEPRA